MKVALVYDRVNKIGGAERVLLAIHEIYPDAPLYTAVYDPKGAPWADVFPKVIPSFLQNFPFGKSHHEIYPWLTPLAFESFNFDEFDVVISVISAEAKGIITKPKTLHICYCLTPTRYLWSGYFLYKERPRYGILSPMVKLLLPMVAARLRVWDQMAAQRPDYYLAISQNVAQRIKKYYQRDSEVIYPPVDTAKFVPQKSAKKTEGGFFLVVSRLISYKRVDIAIEAFNRLGWPLKIVGDGSEMPYLRKIAKPNIEFLGQNLTDSQLLTYYQNCRAIIFPGEEDFGLVPIEAQACGKPVIGFKGGGVLESVIEGVTGEFFSPQTPEALIKAVKNFKDGKYKSEECRKNAERFSKENFKGEFKKFVESI